MENKKEVKKPLTPEEQKAIKEAKAKAREEDRLRAEFLSKHVFKMSFKQLRGKLKRESRKPSDTSPLTSALATILLAVFENTKTEENPTAKSRMNPGW